MSKLDEQKFEDRPFFSRKQVFDMHYRFVQAMLSARKAGLERFIIGVYKDNTPLVPTHFPRIQYSSGMGSAAQVCIDEMSSQRWSRAGR